MILNILKTAQAWFTAFSKKIYFPYLCGKLTAMDLSSEFTILSRKLLPETKISDVAFDKCTFIETLSPFIAHLLNQDFQKLVQIIYRIDVAEKEFALTLVPNADKDIAEALSELIYERLIVKAKYRAKYKMEKNA